ncbi:acidic leucine-rich nuclear phosphoprotein 32 family member A-like [Oratosquilla oratoria]|uniref:acidic leucine-rich nuclear phosphoprotein 32 family member A-like n=1 Tax=Oratosquilla oratoria TaxID=337810 RepID=UPI003F778124
MLGQRKAPAALMTDMEKRIQLEQRGRNPAKITELNLDNCKSTTIVGLTEEFKKLRILSLINVGLTSLKGFPRLPQLRKLELSDNRISGGLNAIEGLPKLSYLNLSGNKIKEIETLEPLKELKNLRTLDLFNCEVGGKENYREKIFQMVPSLVYLDGFDKDENSEAEDEGEEEEEEEDEDEGFGANGEDDAGEGEVGEEEEVEEEEEVDEDEDEDDWSLGALYKEYNEADDDGEDYEVIEDEDEDVEEEDEVDEDGTNENDAGDKRGEKRKHEEDE